MPAAEICLFLSNYLRNFGLENFATNRLDLTFDAETTLLSNQLVYIWSQNIHVAGGDFNQLENKALILNHVEKERNSNSSSLTGQYFPVSNSQNNRTNCKECFAGEEQQNHESF